jgi:hypothetical protein
MKAMQGVFRAIRHPFEWLGSDCLRQSFREPDGNAFLITIEPRDARFLYIETRTGVGAKRRSLDELNQVAPIGCFLPVDSAAEIVHRWELRRNPLPSASDWPPG